MAWVGSELTISARKSGRRGKVGHTAANRADGFAQQSMMLNKEVVKWKEKGDCKGGRKKNELSLRYSFPPGVPAEGSHLGAPPALPPVPRGHWPLALHWSERDWAQFKFPVGCGELIAKVSPALGSLTSGAAFPGMAVCEPGASSGTEPRWVCPKQEGT